MFTGAIRQMDSVASSCSAMWRLMNDRPVGMGSTARRATVRRNVSPFSRSTSPSPEPNSLTVTC